jgi:hypothetical protein
MVSCSLHLEPDLARRHWQRPLTKEFRKLISHTSAPGPSIRHKVAVITQSLDVNSDVLATDNYQSRAASNSALW